MHKSPKTHQSLERALDMLLQFKIHNLEMGTLELGEKLGLHKSTTSRILSVLKNYGFLQQNPVNKKYSLGPSISQLGVSLRASLRSNLTQIAKPYLDELRNKVGESIVLELPTPEYTVLAYVVDGLGPVRIRGVIGDHHHYHASAGGKVILAFEDPERVDQILTKELAMVTPQTKTDRLKIEKELAAIRHDGFSFDQQENNLGIQAFAAPIFNAERKPVAAVVIAGSVYTVTRDKKDEFVALLKDVASEISEQLFFMPTDEKQIRQAASGASKT
jgi:IclR family transcriptional regulator, KDG regulon repressor